MVSWGSHGAGVDEPIVARTVGCHTNTANLAELYRRFQLNRVSKYYDSLFWHPRSAAVHERSGLFCRKTLYEVSRGPCVCMGYDVVQEPSLIIAVAAEHGVQ